MKSAVIDWDGSQSIEEKTFQGALGPYSIDWLLFRH